jgi:serine phosphatase RsbU (regulator of sigma subunit)
VTSAPNISKRNSDQVASSPWQERPTQIVIGAVIVGALILVALVGALTILPAQQITQQLAEQNAVAQEQVTTAAARQAEAFFNGLGNELLALIQHSEILSTTRSTRDAALKLLNESGTARAGVIKSIVRLDDQGNPVYAWPPEVNAQIANGQKLQWSLADRMTQIVGTGGVQFFRRSSGDVQQTKYIYLLVTPIVVSANSTEALAFELDLGKYFEEGFKSLRVSDQTQVWVISPQLPTQVIYERLPALSWKTYGLDEINDTFFQKKNTTYYVKESPADDRNLGAVPAYSGFTQTRGRTPSLVVVTSRVVSEGQSAIFATVNRLFLAGLGVVMLILFAGLLIGRFVITSANRRRQEDQRRSTIRTLLEMSRALNSSLDLPVVLNKILDELAELLPYDSASVVLLDYETDPDAPTVRTAAARGAGSEDEIGQVTDLKKVRGTREVVRSGKPVVINDTKTDPRWNPMASSATIEAWMGVPLRLRDQAVGVLNLNSNLKNRFGTDDQELVEAFADQACVAIENARAHEMQIKQYETELETAHAIQTSLLPSEVPPISGLEIYSESLPARHVSGDYYQYLPLPDGKLGVAVGDVSGKGIPAALLMAVITTALREEVLRHKSPSSLLNQLNLNLLDRMQQNNMNSALLVSIYDPLTRRVEVSNGGMVQPYVRTPAGWEFVPVGGYPLGASARSNYSSKTVILAPESMLLFISDGVIEAQNHANEFFGFERLEALLNGLPPKISAKELVDCILQAVHQHLDGLEAQDDVTVVVMKSQEV